MVGASATVAASPPLVLTRCLEGLFAQGSTCLNTGQPGTGLSANDREYPALTGRSDAADTPSALTHDAWQLGAPVFAATQRATHYEGVTMHCSRAQTPGWLHVCRWLLVSVVGC